MTTVIDPRTLLRSLASRMCPARCGKRKSHGSTFCGACYRSLPKELRGNLYHRMGRRYAEAVQAALAHLGVDEPAWPKERDCG